MFYFVGCPWCCKQYQGGPHPFVFYCIFIKKFYFSGGSSFIPPLPLYVSKLWVKQLLTNDDPKFSIKFLFCKSVKYQRKIPEDIESHSFHSFPNNFNYWNSKSNVFFSFLQEEFDFYRFCWFLSVKWVVPIFLVLNQFLLNEINKSMRVVFSTRIRWFIISMRSDPFNEAFLLVIVNLQ